MTLAVVLMGMTAANAQLVIGGGLNFTGKASEIDKSKEYGIEYKSPATFEMSIAPKIGYMLADQKLEIGAALAIGYEHTMNYDVLFNKEGKEGKAFKDSKEANFNFFIKPYMRYRLVNVKGFGLWLEGMAGLGTQVALQDKYYAYKYSDEIVGRTEEAAKKLNEKPELKSSNFTGGISIQPVLTYDINEHWRLETGLNFLSFYVYGTVDTQEEWKNPINHDDGKIKTVINTCSYGIGLDGGNVASIGYITIGAAYKF